MPPPDDAKRELTAQWIGKARDDVRAAHVLLDSDDALPAAAAFHCQQAAEKFLKGFLTWHQTPFQKTHDLDRLLDVVGSVDADVAAELDEIGILTRYGVEVRYPGEYPPVSDEESRAALQLAEKAGEAVLGRMSGFDD